MGASHGPEDDSDRAPQRRAERLRSCECRRGRSYENVSEYIQDLIRRDRERVDKEAFDRLKAELAHAFAAPEPSFRPLTAVEVFKRNRT
jgi:hypothetical protein